MKMKEFLKLNEALNDQITFLRASADKRLRCLSFCP